MLRKTECNLTTVRKQRRPGERPQCVFPTARAPLFGKPPPPPTSCSSKPPTRQPPRRIFKLCWTGRRRRSCARPFRACTWPRPRKQGVGGDSGRILPWLEIACYCAAAGVWRGVNAPLPPARNFRMRPPGVWAGGSICSSLGPTRWLSGRRAGRGAGSMVRRSGTRLMG